ncbi:ML domain [Popillia japonica]|uniref:ML domain n=1 Tax=Popillia japonica TaxID=7064 RepID=A0AAW1JCK1_POPJA
MSFVVYSSAAIFQQCRNGAEIGDLDSKVSVTRCTKAPCRLKKGTQVDVDMKLKLDKDVQKIVNLVYANIAGIPFPFIGVDNTNACPNIYEADGTTKANCPLKAGKEYVYKNKINVLDIYPRIKVIVHWELQGSDGSSVFCFEVPARITN